MDDLKKIKELRAKIDSIDDKILELLNQRARFVIEIGKTKLQGKRDFYAPEREKEIYHRLTQNNQGPFPNQALKNVFREIMSASLSLEKPLKVAYLGPKATFTHQACMQYFGLSAEFVPKKDIADVFDDVNRAKVDFGVVPIENTTEGVVSHTIDMFVTSDIKICGEITIEVALSLLNKTGKLGDVKKIYSHPHAIAECKEWLKEHVPDVPVFDVSSTAMAAQTAGEDPSSAAIASEFAAALYDLQVVEKKIEDHANNFTRFLVIGNKSSEKSGGDKTSVMFAIKDMPGALYRMLKPFAERGINLTKIESRPQKGKAWEYVFFADMDGHVSDSKVSDALKELEAQCSFMKILGSYPKGAAK
ncbi:MAG: chorismate mutase [Deltaproteobacteria bacterium RIFCSPLOWO2_12_FULL_43_16]|nr:MAG: chorismate mutase [Deltaproteobacteria bacterium RIFCSPHIGHO2_02_FULL_43_33]OGQ61041.1 MAG: chorismate mutase [Deltaproteobacteria bacterium RIFCSPLOWO2_12_FULL_43_16]HBR18503.1 prephenate dehydratase [Deltaproteobacteria bacterium]